MRLRVKVPKEFGDQEDAWMDGYDQGFVEGESEGFDEGWDDGYMDGAREGVKSKSSLLDSPEDHISEIIEALANLADISPYYRLIILEQLRDRHLSSKE